MPIVKNILVPTDLSESSLPALEVAIDLSLMHHAGLTLLHVHESTPFGLPNGYVENMPSQLDRTYEALERHLIALERKARSSGVQRVEKRILQGKVVDEILGFSRGFECVVLGTHSRTRLERLVMGSVAQRVLEQAQCRVVVVRPAQAPSSKESR
jgi:nucleotide-binding universal stress UspA family protein